MNAEATTATPSGDTEVVVTPEVPQPPAGTTFTQDQLNAAIAKEKRIWQQQQKDAADKARQAAEEEAKVKQGEFQALAEQRAARIAELEGADRAKAERLGTLEQEITTQVEARVKLLPAEIVDMKPETDDPLVLYRWLPRAEAAAKKLAETPEPAPPPRNPGTPPGPRGGSGIVTTTTTPTDAIAAKRASGGYDSIV